MEIGVVWFKRDLRLHDHGPLLEAAERCGGGVVGLYIEEPIVLQSDEHDPRHQAFVNDCLGEIRSGLRDLGTDLLIARGEAVGVLSRLHEVLGFRSLFSHEETGLLATYRRDLDVAGWARASGVEWIEQPQHGVFRPLKSRDGWARRWRARFAAAPADAPTSLRSPPAEVLDRFGRGGISEPADAVPAGLQRGGSRAGTDLLESFLHRRGRHFQREMSNPLAGAEACSRLSPHLAYGSVSIRSALHASEGRRRALSDELVEGVADWRRSLSSFEKRLRWHCHFIQKLEDEPEIEHRNFNRGYDGLRVEDAANWSSAESERFESFVRAETGYPFVDACLRCLRETGWINFRMRAMLMSFASYHLWLHWKRPAVHFARLFTDFEPGIHYSQCQMQAGVTGINTVRIYSPIKQQAEHDPMGEFVRRWVPELEGVPDEFLASPQGMPGLTQQMAGCVIGTDYPGPIVDHRTAYAEAKRLVFERRGTLGARREAERVYRRHGSRKRPVRGRSS